MDTPPLKKATTATVELFPQFGMDGRLNQLVIIKELFSCAAQRGPLARVGGAEVRLTDVPWDEDAPEAGNTKLPSDLCLSKPGTDVVVVGDAVAPRAARVTELDVRVRVGPVQKELRVFGTRVWYRAVGGLRLTAPEPFERVELRWDRAFGGFDASDEGAPPLEEPRNPIGRGLARDPETLEHQPAPQIEDPTDLIRTHRSRPRPAGVAAIGRHWSPRRERAGTYDDEWREERMPLPPLDFDARHNQCASPDLVSREPLRGGEPVELLHLSPDGPFAFALPQLSFFVGSRVEGELRSHPVTMDTVVIDTRERTVELTFRACVPVPRPARRLHYVLVNERRRL